MGACGCGDYQPFAKFDGPPGFVYTLSFYTGCDDCDTPAGLIVTRFSEEEAKDWDVLDLPEAPWNDYSSGWADVAVPFLKVGKQTIGATFDEWWRAVSGTPVKRRYQGRAAPTPAVSLCANCNRDMSDDTATFCANCWNVAAP